MAFRRLGCASWLALPVMLAACGNRDETHVFHSAGPLVNPVLPEPTVEAPPVITASEDAGVDAGAGDEPSATPVEDAGGVANSGDAGVVAPAGPPPLPASLCERLGPAPLIALDAPINELLFAQLDECQTAGLLLTVEDELTLIAWANYLTTYSYVLLGCPEPPPVPGGFDVFALSNTGVEGVDVPPPAIGSDDAEALIKQYLDAFTGPLALTPPERAGFEAYLRHQAGKVVDPEVSGALSICEAP
jgi:hypothetical protein